MLALAQQAGRFFLASKASPRKALVFFTALSLAVHFNKILFGPDAPIRFQDTFDSEFPRFANLVEYIRENGIIEWYPNIAGGIPVNAFHFTLFHPLVLLADTVPPWLTYTVLTVLYGVIAGYGFYRLMTEFFDIGHSAALLGATLFFLVVHHHFAGIVFHTFIFAFPLFFVLLHSNCREERRIPGWVWSGLGLATLALLSYPILGLFRFTVLHGAILLIYFLWRRKFDWRMVAAAAVFWTGYGLIFLPNYLALMDFVPLTHRIFPGNAFDSFASIGAYLIWEFPRILFFRVLISDHLNYFGLLIICCLLLPASRLTRMAFFNFIFFCLVMAFFYSDLKTLFAGTFIEKMDLQNFRWVLPFSASFFITVSLWELQNQPRETRRRFLIFLLSTSFGLVLEIIFLPFMNLPIGIWLPALFVTTITMFFVLFALAAIKPEAWQFPLIGRGRMLTVSMAILMILIVFITGQPFRYEWNRFTEMFSDTPALVALAGEMRTEPFRVAMVGLHPAQAQMTGLETFGGTGPLFNRFYKDYAGQVLAPQLQDEVSQNIFDTYWYHILMSGWQTRPPYSPFLPADNLATSDWNLALLAAANVRYVISANPIDGLTPRHDLLAPALAKPTLKDRGHAISPYVYPLSGFLSRGYLVSGIEILQNREAVIDRLNTASSDELAATAFLAQEDVSGLMDGPDEPRDCGKSAVEKYTPDRLIFEVDAATPCLFIVTNNFDSKWQATLNGESATLLRANHAFMALALPEAGTYTVELAFDDPRFPAVLATVPLGAFIVMLAPLAGRRRKRIA